MRNIKKTLNYIIDSEGEVIQTVVMSPSALSGADIRDIEINHRVKYIGKHFPYFVKGKYCTSVDPKVHAFIEVTDKAKLRQNEVKKTRKVLVDEINNPVYRQLEGRVFNQRRRGSRR